MLWTIVGIVVIVLVVLFLLNRKAFSRTSEAASAQVGKAGWWLWKKDPAAIHQKRIDDATQEIRDATSNIEEYKGSINTINRQVSSVANEVAILDQRIKDSLRDDPEDKNGQAAKYAVQLDRAEQNLKTAQNNQKIANTTYQNNIKKLNLARAKIKEAEERGKQLGVELKMAKTTSAIAALATKTSINIQGVDGLSEIEEEIRQQIDKERAKGEVAADLGMDGMAEIEEEERISKSRGADLLAKYKSKMN